MSCASASVLLVGCTVLPWTTPVRQWPALVHLACKSTCQNRRALISSNSYIMACKTLERQFF